MGDLEWYCDLGGAEENMESEAQMFRVDKITEMTREWKPVTKQPLNTTNESEYPKLDT